MFDTYSDISPQELCAITLQVENLHFPPHEPVDTIFTEIEELATISELARAPITSQQKINMGYLLLQNTQLYSTALTKWNQLPQQDLTWERFKAHFRNAQKALRRTGALTINDAMNHSELLNLVQQGVHLALAEKPPSEPTDITSTSGSSSTHQLNSVTSDITLQTLNQQMELMQQMMATMQSMQASSRPQSQQSKQRRNPNQSKYCWTHGL